MAAEQVEMAVALDQLVSEIRAGLPYERLAREYGMTVEHVAKLAASLPVLPVVQSVPAPASSGWRPRAWLVLYGTGFIVSGTELCVSVLHGDWRRTAVAAAGVLAFSRLLADDLDHV